MLSSAKPSLRSHSQLQCEPLVFHAVAVPTNLTVSTASAPWKRGWRWGSVGLTPAQSSSLFMMRKRSWLTDRNWEPKRSRAKSQAPPPLLGCATLLSHLWNRDDDSHHLTGSREDKGAQANEALSTRVWHRQKPCGLWEVMWRVCFLEEPLSFGMRPEQP